MRNRRRVALAITSVTFGITALILAGGFIEWIFWATREGTIQSGTGHIVIAKKGFHDHGQADLNEFLLPADPTTLKSLRERPDVRTVAPRRVLSGLMSYGDATLSFLGEAVDPESERDFSDISIIVKGANLSGSQPSEIIVGQGLAANLGVSVGDTVVLLTSKSAGGINAVDARVRGLFATISKAYDDSAIRIPLPLADQLLKSSGTHEWVVVLRRTEDTRAVVAQLRDRLENRGLEIVPWYDMADFYKKTVALLSRQMGVIEIIIGLIIVLTIGNSMMMGVIERTNEIGTTMALGTGRRGVLLQFVLEGLLLGAIGGLLGAGLGVALADLISLVGIPMPPPPGRTHGYRAEIMITLPLVLSSLAIAVSAAVIGAVYPAWRASRTPIVDALRHSR